GRGSGDPGAEAGAGGRGGAGRGRANVTFLLPARALVTIARAARAKVTIVTACSQIVTFDRSVAGTVASMEYRPFAHTGVQVSPLCLGAMMFGGWGNTDHDECVRIIHRALDAGINFVDTADVYARGESEEIVGKALTGGRREHVILASKVHGRMGEDANEFGNSRRWIIKEVDNSLRRLRTDWIDLYQIHRPEPDTDIEETLGALSDLVHAGKVRYIGSSTFPASQIVEAQWVAERHGLERFVCEQPPYSILARGIENDVLPTCLRHRVGTICWGPLGGGWLSGRYRKDGEVPKSLRAERLPGRYDLSEPGNQLKLEAADALAKLAEEAGMSLIEMSLAFVIRHPAVTAAIIGPRTMEHLESQLTAADVELSDELLDRIDEIVPPGINLRADDAGWENPALDAAARRR
ncbi:MAG TPA: aldo/keto reductase, partial [Solirubrobacteraceae bacterium]